MNNWCVRRLVIALVAIAVFTASGIAGLGIRWIAPDVGGKIAETYLESRHPDFDVVDVVYRPTSVMLYVYPKDPRNIAKEEFSSFAKDSISIMSLVKGNKKTVIFLFLYDSVFPEHLFGYPIYCDSEQVVWKQEGRKMSCVRSIFYVGVERSKLRWLDE